ncbi:hypothetical protein COV11_04045 [Candidatus Woesearchaeota archaeon CG10_big_fil_rev_8_21_14_0_10_30_7]|nr:MAG: hypothetical protein COV11_04045 [Candidatus Woesearchaeota archaeon CG10_big_fil_rev_8_21_14_0_10_30_7]
MATIEKFINGNIYFFNIGVKMSLTKKLGILSCAFALGLPACVALPIVKAEISDAADLNSTSVEEYLFDGELEFIDYFPISEGVHHVRFFEVKSEPYDYTIQNNDGTKTVIKRQDPDMNILEIIYDTGIIEQYWDINDDLNWDFVEEVVGNTITLFEREFTPTNKNGTEYELNKIKEYWRRKEEFNAKYKNCLKRILLANKK